MGAVEDLFVTRDVNDTFNMIEDESGDLYWGYGHQEAKIFVGEVNRWLVATGTITDPDDFIYNERVDHLWARRRDDDSEWFDLVEPTDTEADAFIFPVTRLKL